MQARDVLFDLNFINSQCWDFCDDDSSERIRHRQVCILKLELDRVRIYVEDFDLDFIVQLLVEQVRVADVCVCVHYLRQ